MTAKGLNDHADGGGGGGESVYASAQPSITNPRVMTDLYHKAACTPSDIWEHVPTLMRFARMVDRVTEFGTRRCVSTAALLRGLPKTLVSYDVQRHPEVDAIVEAAWMNDVGFEFRQQDVLRAGPESTDLLFIDTLHTYVQLYHELCRHASLVRRFVIMHDTETYGKRGEVPGDPGLWQAIKAYFIDGCESPKWKLIEHFTNNNGLTIFMRRGEFTPCP